MGADGQADGLVARAGHRRLDGALCADQGVAAEDGLRVRNLILTQTLPWSEIEDVRFGGGEPWVMIEMAEGESVSVMAIQRADGPAGVAEAARLAALVDAHHGGSPSA